MRQFPALKGRIFGVDIHPDGKQLVAVSSLNHTGELKVFDFEIASKFPEDLVKILSERVASRSAEDKKRVEENRNKGVKVVSEVKVQESGLYTVCYHPAGEVIATAGQDGQVRLYEAKNRKVKEILCACSVQQAGTLVAARPTDSSKVPKDELNKLVVVDLNEKKLPEDHQQF